MKVLLSVASFRREYGGPAFSVSQLATALAAAGAKVAVWAPDGSAASSDLIEDGVVRLSGEATAAISSFGRPDILHDNGIWLPHNHRLSAIATAQGLPRLVSPRGMLEPWARRHKRFKKAIAWSLYQARDLKRADGVHATAEAEAQNLAGLNLGTPLRVIGNGIDLPGALGDQAISAGEHRVALFLGRIYPVKGLPMLVKAWAAVRPAGWTLRIAGPDEAGHQAEVEALVHALGLDGLVEFTGPVRDEAKRAAFRDADLFILSSHSESFGMAIGEALAHGLPVLTTRAAPWPSLLENGCGWWVETSVDGLAEGLRQATRKSPEELAAMGRRGRALVEERFSWPSVADAMLSFYTTIVGRSVRP